MCLPFPLSRNVLAGEDHDITALMAHGAALWLGTRTGYILLLDPSALVDGQNPLLGLQYCGKGKVKFIRPLVSPNKPTSKLEVTMAGCTVGVVLKILDQLKHFRLEFRSRIFFFFAHACLPSKIPAFAIE